MKYELAKKLKDAGFPQIYQQGDPTCDFAFDEAEELHLLHCDNDTGWWIGNSYSHSEMTDEEMLEKWVKCPTLEELIKACGPKFSTLTSHAGNPYWRCWAMTGEDVQGSTAQEAVVYLWLALNQK